MLKQIYNILPKIYNWPKEKIFRTLNYSLPFLTGSYIFLTTMPLSAINELCFYLSVSILIFLFTFRETSFTLRSPLTIPFILFFLWAVFGLFFSLDFNNTLHDLRGYLLEYMIVFYLLINYFNTSKRLQILALIVIASATISSIGAIVQYYFIEGLPFTERLGMTFKEMHADTIGFFNILAICLSLHFLYKIKNVFYKILLVNCISIMTITTLLTQCRGPLLGLFAALVILCFHNRKNVIFIIIITFMIILMPIKDRATNIEQYAKDVRVKINRLTMEVIKEHPITGIGFGMLIYGNQNVLDLEKLNSQLPPEYQQKHILIAPHNTILDITVRTGIMGLLLFLSILAVSLWMLWETLKLTKDKYSKSWAICLLACFVSFMIQSLFIDANHGPKAVVFYTTLAMINVLWNINIKDINIKNIG